MLKTKSEEQTNEGLGLVTFYDVREAFKTEKLLKKSGYAVKAVLPPPQFRNGCDTAVEFNIVERVGVERFLENNKVGYLDVISIDNFGIRPLELVKRTDFGDSIMIRAGMVKITVDKKTGTIVNISGGGCPDIPYLYIQLIDKKITEAPRPKEIGYTLCAYLLDRAFEEALEVYSAFKGEAHVEK
ncbi:MAG TPA: DUF3343 domain-containing protein [Candidatus Bathyarchaeia archaeon]